MSEVTIVNVGRVKDHARQLMAIRRRAAVPEAIMRGLGEQP